MIPDPDVYAAEPTAFEELCEEFEKVREDAVVDIRVKGWATIDAPGGFQITLDYRTPSDR